MKSLNIVVPEPLTAFIDEKVASGGYASASEVIRDGLRLLQQQDDERLRALRAAIKIGMESGDGPLLEDVTVEEIAARGRERLNRARA